jgi:two-component system, cell cycle sensor histidine kinase and response regulator CckA
MNGSELAKQLISLHQNLKCLFMSGYTENVIAHHVVLDKGNEFHTETYLQERPGHRGQGDTGAEINFGLQVK